LKTPTFSQKQLIISPNIVNGNSQVSSGFNAEKNGKEVRGLSAEIVVNNKLTPFAPTVLATGEKLNMEKFTPKSSIFDRFSESSQRKLDSTKSEIYEKKDSKI